MQRKATARRTPVSQLVSHASQWPLIICLWRVKTSQATPWRNGSASDSRSEGCVFESRRGHKTFFFLYVCLSICELLLFFCVCVCFLFLSYDEIRRWNRMFLFTTARCTSVFGQSVSHASQWPLIICLWRLKHPRRLRGAMVARLTPDQKVACSNPVGVTNFSIICMCVYLCFCFLFFCSVNKQT